MRYASVVVLILAVAAGCGKKSESPQAAPAATAETAPAAPAASSTDDAAEVVAAGKTETIAGMKVITVCHLIAGRRAATQAAIVAVTG